ncbi:MAG: DUF1616 domain-containing protein [Thermoplasmatota archaeon]
MRWSTTRAYDLVGVAALGLFTDVVVLVAPWPPLRIVLGLVFVLFAPGYALVAALFPERPREERVIAGEPGEETEKKSTRGIDLLERVALSFGLSIAVVPLIGLALNYTPWGIRLVPILVSLTFFTIGSAIAGAWRRARLPEDERLLIAIDLSAPEWGAYSPLDKWLTVGLAVAVVAASGALVYVLVTPRVGESFTEFYILGPGGKAEGYPTNLTVNGTARLILGVVNHEHENVSYGARMFAESGTFVNASGNLTFVESSNATLQNWTIPLGDEKTWERNVTFSLATPGVYRIAFELDKPGAATPYRSLHLFVRVTG